MKFGKKFGRKSGDKIRVPFSRLSHVANGLVIATGFFLVWQKYYAPPADAFSASGGRFEPAAHASHVVVVPLLVFACGVLWQTHILPKWKTRAYHRRQIQKTLSGLGLLAVLAPMVASGYLIQVSVDEIWRKGWVAIHLVTSVAWTLAYGIHWMRERRRPSS